MAMLLWAEWLVRFVPMTRWSARLGRAISAGPSNAAANPREQLERHDLTLARGLARRVERAAQRLPYHPKCLPRAMALQYLLAVSGMDGRLVVAMHRTRRDAENGYHAWVELDDEVLIGTCERRDFAPIFTFEHAINPHGG